MFRVLFFEILKPIGRMKNKERKRCKTCLGACVLQTINSFLQDQIFCPECDFDFE